MDLRTDIKGKIHSRQARIGVIGLGYVGLPLAIAFARAGFVTTGLDSSSKKIEVLQSGKSDVEDVPDHEVGALIREQALTVTNDYTVLNDQDVIIICVPTPLSKTKDPDLSFIISAVEGLKPYLHAGHLIILESTTYPGTTDELILPLLEETGLKVGVDFGLAFSPERIDPGNKQYSVRSIPKIVGGITPICGDITTTLYQQIIDQIVPVSSTRTAEMVKILENTFRSVNIGLVNEIALICDKLGIDVWEAIDAAATKPFGFIPFYPGPGLGGHCLDGNETVCIRDETGVRVFSFSELFEYQSTPIRTRINGVDVKVPSNLEALSVDMNSGHASFERVSYLFRRAAPAPVLQLNLSDHRKITVTDGHPMLVHNGARIEIRAASDLKTGDPLVVATSWPTDEAWDNRIDLIDMVSQTDVGVVRVMPGSGTWRSHDAVVRSAALRAGVAPKDVYRHNTLPLAAYLDLEASGKAPFPRQSLMLSTGKGSSWNQVPAVIEIDEDFARLIGYYLSEGCLTEDSSLRIRFCFGAHEPELIEDTLSILDRLGIRASTHRLKRWQTVHIKVSSRIMGVLFRDILECGTRSEEMQAPSRMMDAPAPIRRALLSGLLRGDGDVHLPSSPRTYRKNGRQYTHRLNAATAGYFTYSPVLFQQMTLLLQGMGLMPTFRSDKPYIRMNGAQVEALIPLFAEHKRAKLESYRKSRKKSMPEKSACRYGSYATVKLKSIKKLTGDAVYSMEVPGAGTFVSSYGIAVHNCIPIDPHYLSWKLKTLDYTTRFIALASEVNSNMPYYVVSKIVDTLNEAEQSVKGSKILILGVAYKPDIGDERESPAIDIIEILELKGAHVTYHDPYIPRVTLKNERVLNSADLTVEALQAADCVVIVTNHRVYDIPFIVEQARAVVDTRNATKGLMEGREKVVKL